MNSLINEKSKNSSSNCVVAPKQVHTELKLTSETEESDNNDIFEHHENERVFSVSEAALLLKISTVSVYRLIKRKRIRCLGSLRHKRIPNSELTRFLQEDLN